MIRIQLFGTPTIVQDQILVKIPRRRTRAFLYYLAGQARPLHRDHLLRVFWIDAPRRTAQQLLRSAIYGIRQALGPNVIQTESETVELNGQVFVDAQVFTQILETAQSDADVIRSALNLYQGEFLADFSLDDCPEFDAWATMERERHRRLAIRGWDGLRRIFEDAKNYTEALASLDRALLISPLQEDLQREAIRLQYLSGDRPGAIQRYDLLRRTLDDELGVPPMVETRNLYDAILTDRLVPTPASIKKPLPVPQPRINEDGQLPFVGRSAELSMLREPNKNMRLVLVEGEPGIGKTRLVEEALQSLPIVTLIGRGREFEKALPYQPMIEALRMLTTRPDWVGIKDYIRGKLPVLWLNEISRLLPEILIGQHNILIEQGSADESRLWEGVHQFFAALATLHPLALFFDDLHLFDASTLALLDYLVRQPDLVTIRFLATTRPPESKSVLNSLLQSLTRKDSLKRIRLTRLSKDEIEQISRALTHQAGSQLSAWLQKSSEGNAYILVELVRHLRRSQILNQDGSIDQSKITQSPIVPQTIYSLILSRLERLSDAARRIFDAGVAAGREFEFEVVGKAAGLSEPAAIDALDELLQAGLILPINGSRFYFDHPLTMEVGFRDVGDLRHGILHRRVGEAIETVHQDRLQQLAGLLSKHFDEGQDLKKAAYYAVIAGEQALHLAAWAEAISFFEIALKGLKGEKKLSVLIKLGETQRKAAQMQAAIHTFESAIELMNEMRDESKIDQVYYLLTHSLLSLSRFSDVIELAQKMISWERRSSNVLAELAWGTALSIEGSNLTAARQHLLAAQSHGADSFLESWFNPAQIAFELGSVMAQQGDLDQAIVFYKQALEISQKVQADSGMSYEILAYNNLAYHMLLKGDPEAQVVAWKGLELAEEKGEIPLRVYLYSTLGEIALDAGNLTEAEQYFRTGLDLAERLSIPERIAGLTANLGLVALQRNDRTKARHDLQEALSQSQQIGTAHLSAQIQLWLAPLLSPSDAKRMMVNVLRFAEQSGRSRLRQEAERLLANSSIEFEPEQDSNQEAA